MAFVSGFGGVGRSNRISSERAVRGFVKSSREIGGRVTVVVASLDRERIWNKSYQLDELEDKDSTTTALYLNRDGTVDCGNTTGPIPKLASGEWDLDPKNNRFMMKLTRTFEQDTGDYEVKRTYDGEMSMSKDEELINFEGKLILRDFPVGYFKMISASDDLPEEHMKALG
ncbi:hypothetical protein NDN08_001093 [Rhodosorus marinus]|uniref:Uncharacterized protein n=1 Tax=Rhodosorus marinus TaxID=101924 RepID=A0AAV8UPV7_9RHOD|nr:hypothetical protein NDN08_001093 [Rhodosorus marinus]